MKIFPVLLISSLVANGALVAVLALNPPRRPPAPSPGPAKAGPVAAATTAAPDRAAIVRVPVANLWSRLKSTDYDEFNRRLRAAGFPARTTRALLGMAISEEQSAREEAIRGKREDIPYWKYAYQPVDAEQQVQLQQSYRENRELRYKFVDGPDALADSEEALVAAQRRFGKLPLEKLQRLTALQHDAEVAQAKIYDPLSLARDPAAMKAAGEAMQAQEKEKLATIAKFLTPEELEQYELRNNTGGLRMQLASFRPTEEEFKALYAVDKQRGSMTDQNQYMALVQATLSADRYAEYAVTLTSDGRGKLGQLMGRLELPLTTITTINTVREDIRARTGVIDADPALTPAQRETQLAALAQEADEKLSSTLGTRGYEAYVDMKGDWIRALKPKAGRGNP